MKKILPLLLSFFCFATLVLAQSPGQALRGTVTDADTGEPLVGATISLPNTNPIIGTTTSVSGSYLMDKLPVGRYQVKVSYIGHEPLTITEVLIESGRETVLNVQLLERADSLQTIVVKATSQNNASISNANRLNFSVEEQFRFPGTNFDPARLAMAYPGVAGDNDGTNIISVRGNSPNALQWRLEGVEIVNPNHTANAGTFGDRPTGAAGGVNILSAQLLGSSSLLTGAFPAQYGNAIGGIMDMSLRKGNDQHHEIIAQAGFIGIEAAVEGPLTADGGRRTADGITSVGPNGANSGQPGTANHESPVTNHQSRITPKGQANHQPPSFLANYRYSFTGLLTAMGADFGDEETAYQDLAFHVALPGKKGGNLSFFGMVGKSSTLYHSPTDSATIDKEQFDIDFNSKMGAVGMSNILPVGKRGLWRTVAVLSALEHGRIAYLARTAVRTENDDLFQQKLSIASNFSQKISTLQRIKFGLEATFDDEKWESKMDLLEGRAVSSGWSLHPFFNWQTDIGTRFQMVMGLHGSFYNLKSSETLLEPRLNMAYKLGRSKFFLSYSFNSQRLPTSLILFQAKWKQRGVIKSHQLSTGYQIELANSMVFKAEAYWQYLYDVPIYMAKNGTIYSLNLTDFSLAYLSGGEEIFSNQFGNGGKGRNYGLDLSIQKYLTEHFFFLLAGSIYRSKYTVPEPGFQGDKWNSTRFDGRHTLNLTAGREVAKQKNDKTIINGISGRLARLGGFRDKPIDTNASAIAGYTVYSNSASYSIQQDDYFRIDLRLYKKWNKTGKNSMLSLDIQNLTNQKNIQYHYYDTVQGKVLEKRQLGLIPILTWRGEF